MKKTVSYILLFLLASAVTQAQRPELEFNQFESEQRLSKAAVSWMTQDKKGFLWLATETGLFKYDGYNFNYYRANANNKGSLTNNLQLSVYSDNEGSLWVGTFNGLNLYNKDQDNFKAYFPTAVQTLGTKGNFIHRIGEDAEGTLWIGTQQGLFTFNKKDEKFSSFPAADMPEAISTSPIRSLLVDKNDFIWIGTEKGLFKYDKKNKKFSSFIHEPSNPRSLRSNKVRSIFEDSNGTIWIGTERGLHQLIKKDNAFKIFLHNKLGNSISSDTVLSIIEDNHKKLWIGTWNGLNTYDLSSGIFKSFFHDPLNPKSLSSNSIISLYKDNSETIWVGTNRGVNKLESKNKKFHSYFNSKNLTKRNNFNVTAFTEAGRGNYWIGILNFLVFFERQNEKYTYIDFKINNEDVEVLALAKDNHHNLWVGTNHGLVYFDTKRRKIVPYFKEVDWAVWIIHIDQEDNLWLGTISGLFKFSPGSAKVTPVFASPVPTNSISKYGVGSIVEDTAAGVLWVGTIQSGLKRIDKKSNTVKSFTHQEGNSKSISSNMIGVLTEDSAHRLWVGTLTGVNLFDKQTETFTFFPDPKYESNEVCGIFKDKKNNLWINYHEGICNFNLETGERDYYNYIDGIQSEYFVGDNFQSAQGEIFFTGSDGVTAFHPDSIKINNYIPPIALTNFSVFNRPIHPDGKILNKSITEADRINLNYDQFIFSFEFSALSFDNPEKNQYAYKLEGFENEWNLSGNRRFAYYSNVPPGKTYVFKVKGSNSDGVWNNNETKISVYIRAPFWQTTWFRLLLAGSIASVILFVYKLRVRYYKRQKQHLEKIVQERTTEILNQKEQIEKQANEITRINLLLQRDNLKLEENVKDLAKARVMQKDVSFEEFIKIYPDEETCLKFLADLKWSKGYKCTKCGNATYSPGPAPYSRRCSRCSTIERATTGTIFSRIKFPITKAFYMLFLLSHGKNPTVDELSKVLSHPRQTCWVYKKKLMEIITAKEGLEKSDDGWSHLVLT